MCSNQLLLKIGNKKKITATKRNETMFPLPLNKPERSNSVTPIASIPMPSLGNKQMKLGETRTNQNQLKQKTNVDTINDTKRILANGKLDVNFFFLEIHTYF